MIIANGVLKGKKNIFLVEKSLQYGFSINLFLDNLNLTMFEFISNYKTRYESVDFAKIRDMDPIDMKTISFLSPLEGLKRDIICLGKNYIEHEKELRKTALNTEINHKPIYFSKRAHSMIGSGQNIRIKKENSKMLDYEVELAVVIGKDCENISKEEVKDCILGITLANDISARDLQANFQQWYMGKSLLSSCPIGPYLWLDAKYPFHYDISSYVNGQKRQSDNTSNMIFDVEHIVTQISSIMPLYTGDVILTGTPSGVGMGFKPPKYLKDGDIIKCILNNNMVLENRVMIIEE